MRWKIVTGLILIGGAFGQTLQSRPQSTDWFVQFDMSRTPTTDDKVPGSTVVSISDYFKTNKLPVKTPSLQSILSAGSSGPSGTLASAEFKRQVSLLNSLGKDDVFSTLRRGSSPQATTFNNLINSPTKGITVSDKRGSFQYLVLNTDKLPSHSEQLPPGYVLSVRNVIAGAAFKIDFDVQNLLPPGEKLAEGETLWIGDLPPSVTIQSVGSDKFNLNFGLTQPEVNLYFYRMPGLNDVRKDYPSQQAYRTTFYPGYKFKSDEIKVKSTTINYAGAVSPLDRTKPLNIVFTDIGKDALAAFNFPKIGEDYGYSVGGIFPVDPVEAALNDGFFGMPYMTKREGWIWQPYLTRKGYCIKDTGKFPLAELDLDPKYNTYKDGLTRMNNWAFGTTPPCYTVKGLPMHYGTDITALAGTPVYNSIEGTFLGDQILGRAGLVRSVSLGRAQRNGFSDQYVVMRYMHLDRCNVPKLKIGERIKPGTLLGYVAKGEKVIKCGVDFYPHLHSEIVLAYRSQLPGIGEITSGKYIDSLMFLNQVALVNKALAARKNSSAQPTAQAPAQPPVPQPQPAQPTTPPVVKPNTTPTRPAPTFVDWKLKGCVPQYEQPGQPTKVGPSTTAINVSVNYLCTVQLIVKPNKEKFEQASFWYDVRFTENGRPANAIFKADPKSDVITPRAGGLTFNGKDTYTFVIPIKIKPREGRIYSELRAFGEITFEGTKTKTINIPIPVKY
ncbi:M23 family metallopeptidase [Deinococcus kurensis]|uniref:M23 family metallopeptidase n=1 Tax=Deinococcus kurensis TaxID=2662757 RepID=UPI0012D2EBE2|nr:M23 family metallopeptidase [Deinococcus kurensis]